MTNDVNIQESEHRIFMERIQKLHRKQLESFYQIGKEIKELSEYEGGFYIEKISQKIHLLLETAETHVYTKLEEQFQKKEETLEKYISMIDTMDQVY